MRGPCILCLMADLPLAHIPLFARLDSAEQADLASRMKPRAVSAGTVVVWHGERGESMYSISSGHMSITVPNEKGEHVPVAALGPGGYFGELSLLDGGPRTATVRALEDCQLLELHRNDFMAYLRARPDAALDMLSTLAIRQRESLSALRQMKNPNIAFEAGRTNWWQRVSDVIATVAASQWFMIFHVAWFGVWILLNVLAAMGALPAVLAFDPFPFGLLTMVVSLEAIFLSIFVMVSQNRQSEKDRLRTDLDYQINVRAQTEIMEVTHRLERIEELLRKP